MELRQQVISSIQRHLPDIDDIVAEQVAAHVISMGLRCLDRLKKVKEGDLTDHLLILDARALVEAWQQGPNENTLGNQERNQNQRPQPEQEEEASNRPTTSTTTQRHRDWDFKINWTDIYNISPKLKERLQKGRRLTPSMKRELIRKIVAQVRNTVPGAQRSIFLQVMRDMKKKYPVSFSTELAQGKIGKNTMVFKMKSQFDEKKRSKRKTTVENEAPSLKAAYGCVKWRSATIPEEENEESLCEKQAVLKTHFETIRPAAWDWELIEKNMEITYGSQREVINRQAELLEQAKRKMIAAKKKKGENSQARPRPQDVEIVVLTTEEIRNQWPFLFQPRCMDAHFKILMQKDVLASLRNFFTADVVEEPSKGAQLTKFLLSKVEQNHGKAAKRIKKNLKNFKDSLPPHNAELLALLQLLLKVFEEKQSAIWILIDPTATEDDIPDMCDIPKTPRLFIAGEKSYIPTRIYYTMDGHVAGTADSLLEGIGLLFAAYYVFNVNYEAEAQVTLEFIQRCIVFINPVRGNKRPLKESGGNFSARSFHPKLKSLDDQFEAYLEREANESSSESTSSELE